MKTTREINVNLTRGKLKLRQVTTKNVDASLRVEPPKEPIKPRGVSTTTQADVADIAEKKRRDDIAKEKKLAMKDEKKIVTVEKKTIPVIKIDDRKLVGLIADEIAQMPLITEKKPWNKMNAKERKEYQIEKAKKKEELK